MDERKQGKCQSFPGECGRSSVIIKRCQSALGACANIITCVVGAVSTYVCPRAGTELAAVLSRLAREPDKCGPTLGM